MGDYIKREDAVKIIERLVKQLEPPINIRLADVRSGVLSAKWLVEDMQSTDVVEVVRCKDCVYREVKGEGMTHWFGCRIMEHNDDDWYCSFGEGVSRYEQIH